MRYLIGLVALVCMTACGKSGSDGGATASAPIVLTAGNHPRSAVVQGRTRTWVLHVPPGIEKSQPTPVLYALHGRFGTGANTQQVYGFDAFAAAKRWVVIYPDGYSQSWNDGRNATPAAVDGIDDLAFFDAIDRDLRTLMTVDDRRVFACGMSNGAFMSARLGSERANRFAAIGCVGGEFASALVPTFAPAVPVSVALVHGTADTLVIYTGSSSTLGADDHAALWRTRDGISTTTNVALPDLDPGDGCTVELSNGTGGLAGTAVVRYRIVGGGHTWPGRVGTLDIGNLCRDIDATQVLVDFFTAHPKPSAPSAAG